ncbi:MAG: FAD-binding protein, partial [Butyricicoccus pullicaecorum]|nr:FAD-binding protein [Butyricicoccus pullicaecorum]
GHYENRTESVDIMLRSSRSVINQLIGWGVGFARNPDGSLAYTREGAHSRPRICYHEDITGEEITTKLRIAVQSLPNVEIMEYTTMQDILEQNGSCVGMTAKTRNGDILRIHAKDTVLATGGIGGRYAHSTNFRCLTGDALEVAKKHGVALEHLDYVQIHPTALYSEHTGRRFLISESARGEGAVLLNSRGERFVDELLPRDVVAQAIFQEMEREGTKHVWLSFDAVSDEQIHFHFPHIFETCKKAGYDITKEPIPVVPAQHYFMGGVHVDSNSQTTMNHLYAVGETSCNGVHGKNRLASNSLLESMVFAERAANHIAKAAKGYKEQ